jgi:hypothetical protein
MRTSCDPWWRAYRLPAGAGGWPPYSWSHCRGAYEVSLYAYNSVTTSVQQSILTTLRYYTHIHTTHTLQRGRGDSGGQSLLPSRQRPLRRHRCTTHTRRGSGAVVYCALCIYMFVISTPSHSHAVCTGADGHGSHRTHVGIRAPGHTTGRDNLGQGAGRRRTYRRHALQGDDMLRYCLYMCVRSYL